MGGGFDDQLVSTEVMVESGPNITIPWSGFLMTPAVGTFVTSRLRILSMCWRTVEHNVFNVREWSCDFDNFSWHQCSRRLYKIFSIYQITNRKSLKRLLIVMVFSLFVLLVLNFLWGKANPVWTSSATHQEFRWCNSSSRVRHNSVLE